MAVVIDRFKRAWNAFRNDKPYRPYAYGGSGYRQDRTTHTIQNERSVVNSIFNQIAVHCSSINIRHVKIDENERYKETIYDSLNRVFAKCANIDQTGRQFVLDVVMSMFDEGCVALVPTDTTADPNETDSYEVLQVRCGRITKWYPKHVLVNVYDENTGTKKDVLLAKRYTPIIENPFYSIMNEPNSTLQRLLRTYRQLDRSNEKVCSDKLDLIIQLPYVVKNDLKKAQAEQRLNSIETQLMGSPLGIAYIDGTERVIQLNRAVENNLWNQAKDLKVELFAEMGLSQSIFDGTANEQTMLNYYNQIVEPILSSIVEEVERKWISRTAQTQGQSMKFFRDPFKLVPVAQLAEMSDKLTRNEILTSNEVRSIIGMKPSDDPRADELRNSNLNRSDNEYSDNEKSVLEKEVNFQNE